VEEFEINQETLFAVATSATGVDDKKVEAKKSAI
jgi:hypothetical protein